jgi:hypothetical protein
MSRRRGGGRSALAGAAVFLVLLAGAAVLTLTARAQQAPQALAWPPPLLPGAPPLRTPLPAPAATVTTVGYDVSHPQCGRVLPADGGFAIVGVTGGRPMSSNRCVGSQLRWAAGKQGRAVYVNTGYPGVGDPVAYGRAVVDDAVARERAQSPGGTTVWWLDVETENTWAGTTRENATVLDAMAARLQELGLRVGIYSTPQMWEEIAGSWSPGLPVWYAIGPGTAAQAAAACASQLAGSSPAIVQWVQATGNGRLDHNLVCPAYHDRAGELFQLR